MYKDILATVVGSLNMDMILSMQKVPETGENVLGTEYGYANGGKGANQAVALAKLGAQVKMIGKVAKDSNGDKLLQNLKDNNIDISDIETNGSQTGLAAILLDGEGRNRIIIYEGANGEIVPEKAAKKIPTDTQLLLLQFEINEDAVIAAARYGVEKGITTVVDCGPPKNICLEKMQGITILSPNESETAALTGIYPTDEESILKASEILKQRSKAEFVVLKLGERGCSLWDGNELRLFPPYKSNVVDTTAAGDCFTAALALEYVRSGDIIAACDIGNKAGSVAVSRMGAQGSMPTVEEILQIK